MQKILCLTVVLLLAVPKFTTAQLSQTGGNFICPSDDIRLQRLQVDDNYRNAYANFQALYLSAMATTAGGNKVDSATLYTVPIVVHIIYSGESVGTANNPSDDAIALVIKQTNDKFKNAAHYINLNNPYSGADARIQFCFAHTAPNGNSTTGILRYNDSAHASPSGLGSLQNYLKTISWDTKKYCNLFLVANLDHISPGLAGEYNAYFDGTLYLTSIFWNGLACHELGHYFGLEHTFLFKCKNTSCLVDGDKVCDTPPKYEAGMSGSSCGNPGNTCVTDEDDTSANNPFRPVAMGGLGDRNDANENFMDYTGPCWRAFTQGQVKRMRLYIKANRTALVDNGNCNMALASQLFSFNAQKRQGKVVLSWTTAQEINMSGYAIERSVDGVVFTIVGNVPSKNATTVTTYMFIDAAANLLPVAKVFYRLKQIEKSGGSTYSHTIEITGNAPSSTFAILNTIVQNTVAISCTVARQETVNLRVLDITGKIMFMQRIVVLPNGYVYSVNGLSSLPSGCYFVQISDAIISKTFKIIKQ